MVGKIVLPIAAAAASAAAGFALGRVRSDGGLGRTLNGNQRWMSKTERQLASALIHSGHGHLFKSWPPPGVRDAEKRALLAAMSGGVEGLVPAMEQQRLAVLQPPVAPQREKVLEAHGDTRTDKYYWLRDDHRKDKDVIAHLNNENSYMRAVMADTEALQEKLYLEMRARIKEEDQQVPGRYHGFFYYTRQETGKQYAIHCRRKVPAAMEAAGPSEADVVDESVPEEVLLDENVRKQELGATFYSMGGGDTSPNQQLYAWAEDTVGGEKYTLHVKDLSTGKEVMSPIPNISGNFEWAADNSTLFYVVKDHLDRPHKVFRHKLGTPTVADVAVFEEPDDKFYVGIHKSRSEAVIYISCGSAVTSETRYILADKPESEFQVVLPRVQDVEYSVVDRGEYFYITLRDQARPNSELSAAPIANPSQQKVLIPHSRDVKLEGVTVGERYMVVFERSGGLERARVHVLPDSLGAPEGLLGEGEEIKFDEPAYSMSAGLTGDFDSPILRINYTSLTTPNTVSDMHLGTGKRMVKRVAPVLGGFEQDKYVTERLWATASDGTKVPISVVYRRGLAKLDGSDPMLLNGYGSYEISNDPYFTSNRLCLLDRGFIFAIAHIRGGGEMGRFWYEDGKLLHKTNTFTDFIACAELLLAKKYTQPDRLCIEGRSAGGLLMGAVLNMRPYLFAACIIGVGFVDALTTMLDDTIPLTIIEWEEWGNPVTDPEVYKYMKSYAPVDNVGPKAYPNILAIAGLHDPRVGYWEPAKFVARVRELRTDPSKLLLFKCEMGAGHFSVTGRFERLKEVAMEYAFLFKVLGMMDKPPVVDPVAVQAAEAAKASSKL